VSPVGDPIDPGEALPEDDGNGQGPGRAMPTPARPACRPWLTQPARGGKQK
jgi:hypothetical protein